MQTKPLHVITQSQIRTWKQCRQKHQYYYVDKLTPNGPEAHYFRRGRFLHRYVELMYKNVREQIWTMEKLLDELQKEWDATTDGVLLDRDHLAVGSP